jgi:hypothetical protein
MSAPSYGGMWRREDECDGRRRKKRASDRIFVGPDLIQGDEVARFGTRFDELERIFLLTL